jgi:hypothetical protein
MVEARIKELEAQENALVGKLQNTYNKERVKVQALYKTNA